MVEQQSDAPVTVLFSDIEGSTDLQSRLGDAQARDLVRRHEAVVREALAAHGGHEVKTMGDGFLATFTSTRRALESAIAIQQASDEVRVRIGLHAGEVIHEGDDIHGAAVAAAARVMSQAQGGEIVVSDLVKQLAGAAGVRFRERGRVQLKGLDGQWLLHDVEWQDEGAATQPPGSRSATTALIGRHAETAILQSAIGDAMSGRGRLVLLAGEPGIGKTTLAVNAADRAAEHGARVLWGACWEGEGAPAFWPWIQALRVYAAEHTDDELTADAGAGAPELCRLLPEFTARMPAMPPPPDLEPDEARFRQFDAIASFLGRAAARQPLVVVLDDLHWADESSMRLLVFVAAQLATNRVAIIGTYRDTEVRADHPLASLMHDASRRGQLLPVGGLEPEDVARLMATVSARAELRDELTAAVHRQTAGNPLFVGEMTRLLAAQNALDRDDVTVGVPQGVQEVIERRMVRLPQRCIELLTLGAVVGEEFALDVVARAGGIAIPALVELLEPALAAGAAREATVGHYRFAHALFREALYEGLGTIARAGLHLQVANALEAKQIDAGGVSPSELANHFALGALAGETEKAIRYASLAARQATASLAYSEAVGHYERALHVLDLAPYPTESDRAELLLELSGARWRSGDRAAARVEVDRAIAFARQTGRGDVLARAALGLHRLGGISGVEDNERLRLLEEANLALGDEETPLRARLLAALAKEQYHSWLHFPASIEGSPLAEDAVALGRRLGDNRVLAEALAALHDTLWYTGREARRLDVATELEKVAESIGDREQAVEAVLLQAVALLELGDRDALPRLRAFIASADELHHPRFAYFAATRRATLATIEGDLEGADEALEAAAAIAAAHGEPDHINVSAAQLFSLATLRNNRSLSVERAREAYKFSSAFHEVIESNTALGCLDDGDIDEARRAFRRIDIEAFRTQLRNYGWLYGVAILTELTAALEETAVLEELIPYLEPYADRCIVVAGAVSFIGSAAHYLGLALQAVGRTSEAEKYFQQALATYDRLGATPWAVRTREAMGAGSGAAASNELRRQGRSWTFTYAGATVTVRESKGVRDIGVLLSTPGKDVAAADLMARGEATDAGADAVLDDRARREFRARLTELDDDLGEAERDNDLERISRVKAERDALAHELAAALGLGGRGRKLGDPSERARKAVAARIRDAIEKVATQHAELGQHLRASIRTGTFCAYAPPSPTAWRVTNDTAR